jgi:hypothetical protein
MPAAVKILSAVMAGLVPAIHVLTPEQDVDARDKRGHDESNIAQFGLKRAFTCVAKFGSDCASRSPAGNWSRNASPYPWLRLMA